MPVMLVSINFLMLPIDSGLQQESPRRQINHQEWLVNSLGVIQSILSYPFRATGPQVSWHKRCRERKSPSRAGAGQASFFEIIWILDVFLAIFNSWTGSNGILAGLDLKCIIAITWQMCLSSALVVLAILSLSKHSLSPRHVEGTQGFKWCLEGLVLKGSLFQRCFLWSQSEIFQDD